MKVVYMNDTKRKQFVFRKTLILAPVELAPTAYTVVELEPASDQAVFIKTWGQRVLIGVTDLSKELEDGGKR
jgi:hypothetical protein